MKLGPITKPDKRNKTTSTKIDNEVMSVNCDVIVIFPICCLFVAIRKADSRCIVCIIDTYTEPCITLVYSET